jgi:hypothetical protein
MQFSEACSLWNRERSRLEKLTGKSINTIQGGIDAIKSRMSEIKDVKRLCDSDIEVLKILEQYADALTTIVLEDRAEQARLQEERDKVTASIDGLWDRLN